MSDNTSPWWSEEYGFFGDFYMEGDNSEEGYLIGAKQSLNERTQTEVLGITKILGLEGSESILDIPCGYGRHSIELAKLGYRVTGSDINGVHLSKAGEKAKTEAVDITFRKESMIDIQDTEQFDAIINMFYSFGFFESDEENFKVLTNFYNALKSEGKFLMHTDVNIPRILSGKYKTDEKRKLQSGKTLHIIDKYDESSKRIIGIWEIIDTDGTISRKDYSVRVYTKDEFIDLCHQAGFKNCESYSDWNGSAYTDDSEDIIIVASK
jgi:SAM-dependent methyltransferase